MATCNAWLRVKNKKFFFGEEHAYWQDSFWRYRSCGADKNVYSRKNEGTALIKFKSKSSKDYIDYIKERDFLLNYEHENIIRFLGFDDENLILIQELGFIDLHGFLFSKIEKDGERRLRKIGIKTKLKFLIDIISGIKFMHEMGIIHNDLKLSNILLVKTDGKSFDNRRLIAKLIDFSRIINIRLKKTSFYGTISFMDPCCWENIKFGYNIIETKNCIELAKFNYRYSYDIYSFAILMFEVLYRESIFKRYEEECCSSEFSLDAQLEGVVLLLGLSNTKGYRYQTLIANAVVEGWRPKLDRFDLVDCLSDLIGGIDGISDKRMIGQKLNNLIAVCWGEPLYRLTAGEILDELRNILIDIEYAQEAEKNRSEKL